MRQGIRWLPLLMAVVLASGCPERRTIVRGSAGGFDSLSEPAVSPPIEFTHWARDRTPRVVSTELDLFHLAQQQIEIAPSIGKRFDERYVLVQSFQPALWPGTDKPMLREISNAPGWLASRARDLSLLSIRYEDSAATTESFSSAERTDPGVTWLVRLEDDDRRVPWRVVEGSQNCVGMPSATTWVAPPGADAIDCLDVETLTSIFLVQLGVRVSEELHKLQSFNVAAPPSVRTWLVERIPALATWPPGVDIPLDVNAVEHRLGTIPALELGLIDSETWRGFGLVYEVDLDFASYGVRVSQATVRLPLGFHFRRTYVPQETVTPSLFLAIEPLSDVGGLDWRSLERMSIEYAESTLSDIVAANAHSILTARLATALADNPIPDIRPEGTGLSIRLEDGLVWQFDAVAPRPSLLASYPRNFGFALLPEGLPTDPVSSTALRMGPVNVTSIPGPPTTPATISFDGPMITLDGRPLDSDGIGHTLIEVPRPSVETPHELWFLE